MIYIIQEYLISVKVKAYFHVCPGGATESYALMRLLNSNESILTLFRIFLLSQFEQHYLAKNTSFLT